MVVQELRNEIERLADRLTEARTDPLIEAGVACLEAADRICVVLAERHDTGSFDANEALQDALHATRAAALAIRFAMLAGTGGHGDLPRD